MRRGNGGGFPARGEEELCNRCLHVQEGLQGVQERRHVCGASAEDPREPAPPRHALRQLRLDPDEEGKLPATFMVVAPGSWNQLEVWDDINRMRTLNTTQSRRRAQMHVCPLQLDIVERLINRYSNPGDLVADPFAGLFTVPYLAVKMGRKGKGVELNPDYFRDGVGYCEAADAEQSAPTLFDLMEEGEGATNA